MATKKGPATKKATGERERPDCPPVLRIQAEVLVKAWQQQLYLSSRTEGTKKKANNLDGTPRLKVLIDYITTELMQAFVACGVSVEELEIRDISKKSTLIALTNLGNEIEPVNPASNLWVAWLSLDKLQELVKEAFREEDERERRDFIRHHSSTVEQFANEEFKINLDVAQILEAAWEPQYKEWKREEGLTERKFRCELRYIEKVQSRYEKLQETLSDDLYQHLRGGHPLTNEIGLVLGVLDALEIHIRGELNRWRKQEGFNKPNTPRLQKQAFWTKTIVRVVDIVKPLCRKRLKGEWGGQPKVRERAFRFVARLFYTCYPDVWEDNYLLMKKRYMQRNYK